MNDKKMTHVSDEWHEEKQETKRSESPASSRKAKRAIAASVVAVVVIAAGAGFWMWHEQPSFCNAVCHSPMDPYVEMFQQEAGQPGVDKYGNDVLNTSSMLAIAHKAEGLDCLSCHVPTISEQISEVSEWVGGRFAVPEPLAERSTTVMSVARGQDADSFCLNPACHNYTREQLETLPAVAGMKYNPHAGQHNEMGGESAQPACTDCHKSHRASVMYCTKCHVDADVPEGWITYQEQRDLGFGQEGISLYE